MVASTFRVRVITRESEAPPELGTLWFGRSLTASPFLVPKFGLLETLGRSAIPHRLAYDHLLN
jgi:hypothetical protein